MMGCILGAVALGRGWRTCCAVEGTPIGSVTPGARGLEPCDGAMGVKVDIGVGPVGVGANEDGPGAGMGTRGFLALEGADGVGWKVEGVVGTNVEVVVVSAAGIVGGANAATAEVRLDGIV